MNAMRWMTVAVAALAAALVSASPALAERPERTGRAGGSQANQEEMGARRAALMARRLGLDDATKQKLEELFERQQAERKGIRERLQTEMQKLRQLVRDTAPAASLNAQLDTLRGLQQQMANLQGKSIDEMRAILGPEKTARAVLMLQQRMQSMREQVRGRLQGGQEGQGRNRRNQGRDDD